MEILYELYVNIYLNLMKNQIVKLEIPTGNPLLINIEKNLKIKDCKYLDKDRAKDLLVY